MNTNSMHKSLFAACAVVAAYSGICFANGPAQYHSPASPHQKCDCPKGGKHCGYARPPKPSFWDHCKPHAPPFLPVIQSLAVRSLPPLTDANQLQLSVEMQEADQQGDPVDSNQRRGDPAQKSSPHQKTGLSSPPSVIQSASAGTTRTDERFLRLERQVDLLLQKMDKVLQQETRQARVIDPQVER